MDNKKDNKVSTFKVMNFNEAYVAPVNKYNIGKSIVEWGKKNNYPEYIFDLYNYKGSPTHKSIINKKVKLISGNGFADVIDERLKDIIKRSSLEKETKKASLDYELFNAFAFEVIYTNEGELDTIKHIPYHKLRIGIQNDSYSFDYFWFSNDWSQTRKSMFKPTPIRAYNPNLKQGKQIYVYTEYNPQSVGSYPIVGYSTSMNWIELDYEISVFHLNQAKQGYAPSFILNFSTGIPTEEEMETFSKSFHDTYSGTENAGKIILNWSDGADGAPILTPIQLNDSDDRFVDLMERTDEQIARGAEIPPQLVILTPGKLGSTEERSELLVEFQTTYITPRQNNIEDVLNEITFKSGIKEEIQFQEYIQEQKIIEDK
tara:strand:- start:293 stop:1411 length:1119 start_codon:yes stop_codon:yes gene_type:complete